MKYYLLDKLVAYKCEGISDSWKLIHGHAITYISFLWQIQFNNCPVLASFTYNINYENYHHAKYAKYSENQ